MAPSWPRRKHRRPPAPQTRRLRPRPGSRRPRQGARRGDPRPGPSEEGAPAASELRRSGAGRAREETEPAYPVRAARRYLRADEALVGRPVPVLRQQQRALAEQGPAARHAARLLPRRSNRTRRRARPRLARKGGARGSARRGRGRRRVPAVSEGGKRCGRAVARGSADCRWPSGPGAASRFSPS